MSARDINPAAAMAAAVAASYIKGDDASTCSLCHTRGHVTKDHPSKPERRLCDKCWTAACKEDGGCLEANCPCQCNNRRSST